MKNQRLLPVLCCLSACAPAWSQQTAPDNTSQFQQDQSAADPAAPSERRFPIDVAGYVNFRRNSDDALDKHLFYQEYSASLFLSKTIKHWQFHVEINASNDPEYDSDGIHLIHRRPDLSIKLERGFVNYNARDCLQFRTGILFIPTYWRMHRYQSTTLTVDDPLIDQNVFPTDFKGGMILGDRYFGEGGFSYVAYGGVDQQVQFLNGKETLAIERSRVAGGKLTIHLPSRHFFDTFDVAYHRLHRIAPDGLPDELNGAGLLVRKHRFELLAEFAHASLDIVNGRHSYIRQGYYVQPSYGITRKLFAVARYDRSNRDSRYAVKNDLASQSAGIVYRPVPALSIKMEGERLQPQAGRLPAYYGFTTSPVYFFHLP